MQGLLRAIHFARQTLRDVTISKQSPIPCATYNVFISGLSPWGQVSELTPDSLFQWTSVPQKDKPAPLTRLHPLTHSQRNPVWILGFPWPVPNLQVNRDMMAVSTSSRPCVSRSQRAQRKLLRYLRHTDSRQADVVTLMRRLCAV